MALPDEQADILGGPILQRPESGVFATFSRYYSVFKSVTLLGVGLLLCIACSRGFEYLKRHRELRYRKAMRRKHGIPDSDCRPFAVAYAAAKRAHLEREAQDRKKVNNYGSDRNSLAVDQRTNAQKDTFLLRKRAPDITRELHGYHPLGKHATLCDNERPEFHALDFAERYNPTPRRWVAIPEHRASGREPVVDLGDQEESRKRSFEDESDIEYETIKKSRIDGEGLIDGDEEAHWYAQYSDRSPRRASKGILAPQLQGNYAHMNSQGKSNRVDDVRNEDHELDEAVEGVHGDEALKVLARGKKRDRAEAGSTFGGDDEEDIRNGRASHQRKRRTILRKKIETSARGQKRGREIESPESEHEADSETSAKRAQRSSKKKRGKKAESDEVNEVLVDDPGVSKDPLCGGRRVGEGWEADGVRYKVGDKGERLRLTLVKKARNKYHMPQDSQHPDRSAALEIYVETWMTEGQYKQAESEHELAWQEGSRELSGSGTPDVLDSPAKHGKSLLWDSVKYSPARRPFRQSILPGASTRINPFDQWQSQPTFGRRVASSGTIVSPMLLGVTDSPTRPGFRSFSKWEKQDREAEAMARIRAKIEEQKKAQTPSQKLVEISASLIAPELGIKPSVPTITVTPAPPVTAERKADDSILQNKPNFSFATPSSFSNSIKGTTPAAATSTVPVIPLSSPSFPTTTLCELPPSATVPSTTSSTGSLSLLSFVKPPQVLSSASTAVPSSAMSSILGKEVGANTPSSSSSPLPAIIQPQPPTEGAPKTVPFSFAKPDVSPAVIASSATKPQAPSPALGTFGSIPATAKAEVPIRPPTLAPAATSETSKPTTPLFSFSGTSSTLPAAKLPTSSTAKFSFGQPSATSTFSNLTPSTASQPKPTFKFGQMPPDATDSVSVLPAADGSKKSTSVFGTAGGSTESVQPLPFAVTPASGSSTFSSVSASAASLFGKSTTVDGLTSTPPKSTLAAASVTTFGSTTSSASAEPPASGNAPAFLFSETGTNSGPKSEGSKSAPLFGGAAGGARPVTTLSDNATEGKPTFTFGAAADASKPASVFGNNVEGSKSTFSFGGAAGMPKPALVFDGVADGTKSMFAFNGATENTAVSGPATEIPKSSTADPSKLAPRRSSIGPFPSTSPFMLGKDSATTNSFTPTNSQTKSSAPFTFGAPSGATSPMFGQPSGFVANSDSGQSGFGKLANATPNAFGFAGSGSSSSSNTFAFGKPAAQNQKQEQ